MKYNIYIYDLIKLCHDHMEHLLNDFIFLGDSALLLPKIIVNIVSF